MCFMPTCRAELLVLFPTTTLPAVSFYALPVTSKLYRIFAATRKMVAFLLIKSS
jgi:hypothetical protein